MIEDDSVLVKYNEIWNNVKKTLNIKEFNGVVNTNFWGEKIPKEGVHHTCIACVGIDFVLKMEKKLSTNLFRRMQV